MSGNPFRPRVQLPDGDVIASPSPPPPSLTTNTERKVKRVRIRTPPPLSPESVHETTPLYPPLGQPYEDTYFPPTPPFSRNTRSIPPAPTEQSLRNHEYDSHTMLDLENKKNTSVSTTLPSNTVGGIANPFARTLETIENPHSAQVRQKAPPHSAMKNRNNPAEGKTSKQAMDVDSFKRLLLTGNATSASSAEPPSSTIGSNTYVATASDSTDTPSQSLQSLDDSPTDSVTTSPRTSYEAQRPTGDETTSINPVNYDSRKKAPPPPPKHRHGKVVGQRTPQVVSFADFTPNEDSSNTKRRTSKELPPIPLERTTSASSTAAALPPPASRRRQSEQSITEEQDSSKADLLSEDEEENHTSRSIPAPVPETYSISSDMAPPSPTTSFQLRPPRASRQRADSNQSLASQRDFPTPTSSIADTNSAFSFDPPKPRPPPPPTRRPGSKPISNLPAAPQQSTATNAPSPDTPLPPDETSTISVLEPRRGSIPITPSSRSSSISVSNRSLAPPPPPPRRRRGSSKSSVEFAVPGVAFPSPVEFGRAGGERLGGGGHGELGGVAEGEMDDGGGAGMGGERESRGSRDVLDDLDKLQAEVNALRLRYR